MRESELLGAALAARHSRENLVLEARFLRDDLPYFVELLAEVVSSTSYKRTPHYYSALRPCHSANSTQPTSITKRFCL